MKEKVAKGKKKPWYVRLDSYLRTGKNHKPTIKEKIRDMVIVLAIFGLAGAIGYGISCFKNSIPYEEAYDVEFSAYVNEKLEDVAEEVSTDFQDFSMSPSGDTVLTREEYESRMSVAKIMDGIGYAVGTLCVFLFGLIILMLTAFIATRRWNDNFHNKTTK